MGRFADFNKGDTYSKSSVVRTEDVVFTRKHRQEKEHVSTRLAEVWKSDFRKCASISDFQSYIKKYDNPDNPFIAEAKQRIDDMTFASCKNIEDYRRYLSAFPSGRNVVKVKDAIKNFQDQNAATVNSCTVDSNNSKKSGEEIAKQVVAVIVILPLILLLYLWIFGDGSWRTVAMYAFLVVGPVCKWAYDM